MRISCGYSRAFLDDFTEEERDWVDEFLTFETVSWPGGKRRVKTRSYLDWKKRFPVGLVPMIARHGERAGLTVEVVDTRDAPPPENPDYDGAWLRDYQHDVIAKCLDRTRGVVSSPTGSGKGECITALTWALQGKWLVVVHRDNLVEDLGTRFQNRTGDAAGWVRKGQCDPERVTFATYQALYRRLQDEKTQARTEMLLRSVQGVIGDEAHTAAADTFNAIITRCSNAYYRFGFSGTPFDRTDSRSIAVTAAFGPRIYRIRTSFLIAEGYIPRPIIRMVPCVQAGTSQKKFATVYKHTVEKSAARNAVCLDILDAMDKPGIAFVRKRDHGLALARLAGYRGLNVRYVDGKSSAAQRKEAVKEVERGAVDVLLSTVVFQEGLDLPSLRSTANLAAGQSVIEILQRLGRGMRKEHAADHTYQVWDIYDVVQRPQGSRAQKWLERHSRARAAAMAREEHEVWIGAIDDPNPHLFDPEARLGWDYGTQARLEGDA